MDAVVQRLLVIFVCGMVFLALAAILVQRSMDSTNPRLLRFLKSPWQPIVFAVGVWSIYTIAAAIIRTPGSTLRAVIDSLPMGLFMVGFTLLAQIRARRGTLRRCARCDYDLTGTAADSGTCPECGSTWDTISGTVKGTRAWSPRIFLVAIPLMLPVLATFILPFVGGPLLTQKLVARILPTGSLIADASYARGFTMDTWAELNRRTLTAEQRETLARGLLTRDALRLHAWGDEAKWLRAEFTAGRLSLETQRAVLARLVPLILVPDATGTSLVGIAPESAWGLADAFVGWSIFVVRGPAINPLRIEVAPPHPDEVVVDRALVDAPPSVSVRRAVFGTDLLKHTGPVPADATLTLWLIAEPRERAAQQVIWTDGTPMTAPDALVVRFDLNASAK
jgi:hypothetical protein